MAQLRNPVTRSIRGGRRRALRRWPALGIVLAAGLAISTVAGCGVQDAPSSSALPLISGARVVASAAGGSLIDTAYDHNRYRCTVMSGPAGMSGPTFLSTEVRYAMADGWGHLQSFNERYVGGEAQSVTQLVPITAHRANVSLDSPDGHVHAWLYAIAGPLDEAGEADGSPLYGNAAIGQALRGHRPLVWIELGNGPAPHITAGT